MCVLVIVDVLHAKLMENSIVNLLHCKNGSVFGTLLGTNKCVLHCHYAHHMCVLHTVCI